MKWKPFQKNGNLIELTRQLFYGKASTMHQSKIKFWRGKHIDFSQEEII